MPFASHIDSVHSQPEHDDDQIVIALDRIVEIASRRGDHISHLVRLGVRSFISLMIKPAGENCMSGYPSTTSYSPDVSFSPETLREIDHHKLHLSGAICDAILDAVRETELPEQDLLLGLEVELDSTRGLQSVVAHMRATQKSMEAPPIEFVPAEEEE